MFDYGECAEGPPGTGLGNAAVGILCNMATGHGCVLFCPRVITIFQIFPF